jgi:glucans biosynthesis protein C
MTHSAHRPRAVFIDHLRVALTVLVIWHHSAIMFGGPGGWYLRAKPDGKLTSVLFTLMCSVDQAFFMGAFFLFAGYFTPHAFDKKGAGKFVVDRLLRLGLPLLIYGFVIGPMTVALVARVNGDAFWASWWQLTRDLTFNIGPLWFAYALLLFSAVYGIWRLLSRRLASSTMATSTGTLTHGRLLAAALITAMAAFTLRLWVPVGEQRWGLQIGYFASYTVLFAAGCWLARERGLENIDGRIAKPWGRLSVLVAPSLFVYAIANGALRGVPFNSNGGWTMPALAYAFWEPLLAWGIILMLLWRFRMRSEATRWWGILAPRAYTAYIIHPPILVALAWSLHDAALPNLAKFAITAIAAPVLIFGISGRVLRLPGARRIL